jgi:hypothetical protein
LVLIKITETANDFDAISKLITYISMKKNVINELKTLYIIYIY